MMASRFRVVNWAARAPGRESRAQWQCWAGAAGDAVAGPPGKDLPMMLRRRLTATGQAALAAASEADAPQEARYVFCSRHGEFTRTIRLLQAVAEREALSPADFSVSVHNALAGILSIASQSQEGHTAIASGADSFAAGLIEAIGLLAVQADRPVLLVYFDDDLPPPYDEIEPPDAEGGLALAVLLSAGGETGLPVHATISAAADSATDGTTRQAFDFVRFLASGEAERSTAGRAFDLRWRRAG
jgi:hypothetical protein